MAFLVQVSRGKRRGRAECCSEKKKIPRFYFAGEGGGQGGVLFWRRIPISPRLQGWALGVGLFCGDIRAPRTQVGGSRLSKVRKSPLAFLPTNSPTAGGRLFLVWLGSFLNFPCLPLPKGSTWETNSVRINRS